MTVTLSPWREEMIPAVYAHAQDPRIAANLRDVFPSPYHYEDAEAFVQDCVAREGQGQLCRAILVEGETVGSIGVFVQSDVYRRSAELGYWLAVPWWGKGIMTEAVRAICREAFRAFDIVRIYAEPFARNTGSCRVLEKAGFTLEGTLRRSVYKGGEILDSRVYALLREELELPDIHTHGGERQ